MSRSGRYLALGEDDRYDTVPRMSPVARMTLRTVLVGNVICVLALMVGMPCMAWWTAEQGVSFFKGNGEFRMISDGFRQHSAGATVLIGVCTLFIGCTRLMGIVVLVPWEWTVPLLVLILVACQVGG